MKAKILAKIAITSALCAPACAVENGVIVYKQNLPEERALYINLIRKDKSKQKQLRDLSDEIFDADRKLVFSGTTDNEVFNYLLIGDTISFYNAKHKTYMDMRCGKNRILSINGVRKENIIGSMYQKQK